MDIVKQIGPMKMKPTLDPSQQANRSCIAGTRRTNESSNASKEALYMQAVQRLFILALAFVVTLGAALGTFLFISLVPYFSLVGKVTAGLVITGLSCVAAILVTFTYTKIGMFFARLKKERLHANLLVSGEVVVLLRANGQYEHLSALHEAARHPAQIAGPREDNTVDASSDEETILELHKKGLGLREIASLTNNSYYRVQKVTSGK